MIKGFQSSKRVYKHLVIYFISYVHLLCIDNLCFINLKILQIFIDFNFLTFLLVDLTDFENLSIFFIHELVHSMTVILCLSIYKT